MPYSHMPRNFMYLNIEVSDFAAFVHALNNLEHQYTTRSQLLGSESTDLKVGELKPQDLVTAMLEYGKIELIVMDVDDLSRDPFKHCYVCATSSKDKLSDGEVLVVCVCCMMWALRTWSVPLPPHRQCASYSPYAYLHLLLSPLSACRHPSSSC
jgi:hypothetical protein